MKNKFLLTALMLASTTVAFADFLIDTTGHTDVRTNLSTDGTFLNTDLDDGSTTVSLPFTFPFFGQTSFNGFGTNQVSLSSNGILTFADALLLNDDSLWRSWRSYRPYHLFRTPSIRVWGEDLDLDDGSAPDSHLYTGGPSNNAHWSATWVDALNFAHADLDPNRSSFQATLFNAASTIGGFNFLAGDIALSYAKIQFPATNNVLRRTTSNGDNGREPSQSATIALNKGDGNVANLGAGWPAWPNGQRRAPYWLDNAGWSAGTNVFMPNKQSVLFPGDMPGMLTKGSAHTYNNNFNTVVPGESYDEVTHRVPGASGPNKQFILFRPNGSGSYNSSIRSTHSTTISGQVVFNGVSGIESVLMEVLNSSGAVVETIILPLSPTGTFSMGAPAGAFSGRIKFENFLGRTVQFTSPGTGVNFALLNGDINGDNEVGPGDFAILASAFGAFRAYEVESLDPLWDRRADLNRDGEIGPGDFAILAGSFGEFGD